MIKKKHPQIKHMEKTVNIKWCVSKVPQYSNVFPENDQISPNFLSTTIMCGN